jgi:tryptophan synthase alpha chain
MNRIDKKFKELKSRGKKAFIAYLTVGYPDLETNLRLIREMEKRGVDMVEFGVPFSDPIADGPTIQSSSQAALERGTSLEDAFGLAERLRKTSSLPLILMGYLNPFLSLSPGELARRAERAGIDGLIVPDLPPEEADFLREPLAWRNIHLIFLLAPNSPRRRIKLIAEKSSGFIYYVSRLGVTGARKQLAKELKRKVREIKKITRKPVGVGFGVSTRRQLEEVWSVADGAIVGSALIKPFLQALSPRTGLIKCLAVLNDLLLSDRRR